MWLNMNCFTGYFHRSGSTSIFAQMTSYAVRYDVTYHPFPINSQYLKTWGVDSPAMEINVREEITIKWQNYSCLSHKYSSSSISNVINNKNELWKTVTLTSFQKPTTTIRFKSDHPCHLLYLLCYLYLPNMFFKSYFLFHSIWWQFVLFEFW